MKLASIALASALLLAGCATSPTPLADARPVPTERRFAVAQPSATPPAKISFVMDTGAAATDWLVTVSIDARRAADLKAGEIASFDVEPGERQVSAALNLAWQRKPIVLENRLQPGQHLVYRVGIESIAGSPSLVMNRDVLAENRK